MKYARIVWALAILLCAAVPSRAEDLRERYGTKSLKAAQLIQQIFELQDARRFKEAIAVAEQASAEDPTCLFPLYLKANVQVEMGEIDQGIASYKKLAELAERTGSRTTISIDGMLNLGLTCSRLERYDDGTYWFMRAVLSDPIDEFKMQWKAYRNMAINFHRQGRNLNAALAAIKARRLAPERVEDNMIVEFFKRVGNDECAAFFVPPEHKAPLLPKRTITSELTEVSLSGLDAPAHDLLPDPEGRFVLAVTLGQPFYHLIHTAADLKATKLECAGAVHCAALSQGRLFLVSGTPAKLEEVDPQTGKGSTVWDLNFVPQSVGIAASQNLACFSVDREVQCMDLKTRIVKSADLHARKLIMHPSGDFMYGFDKDDPKSNYRTVVIGGRPILIENEEFDWSQSVLWSAAANAQSPTLVGLRLNAASNGMMLSVSPDGRWTALAGGGGWRPSQGRGGYGVAVWNAYSLEEFRGYFETGAYPIGVAFNPVTAQVVAFTEGGGKVFHLSDASSAEATVKGPFISSAAWSGKGDYLLMAKKGGGIAAYRNKLSSDEQQRARSWFREIKTTLPFRSSAGPEHIAQGTLRDPLKHLETFQIDATSRGVKAAFARASGKPSTTRPASWGQYKAYAENKDLHDLVSAIRLDAIGQDERGVTIFKLNEAIKKVPAYSATSIPAKGMLAELHRQNKQNTEAERLFLEVIRRDAGRTEVTCQALKGLGKLKAERRDEAGALWCFAHALQLDWADLESRSLAGPLLQQGGYKDEWAALEKSDLGASGPESSGLPDLVAPPPNAQALKATELFAKAAESVVLIKAARGTGSAFCVSASHILLTNAHVVEGSDEVDVTAFIVRGGRTIKLPAVNGKVLKRNEKLDLAVIKLDEALETIQALPLSKELPAIGTKVFAIGSPGLGKDVLTQSLSEGLLSSNSRKIEGQEYVQHTAAVNPGNSGGPLLDESGQVIGMVTLKAQLENVSFAIPVDVIRQFYVGR